MKEPPKDDGKKPHLMIIIGVGKPKPGQSVGFRGAKKKRQPKDKRESDGVRDDGRH